MIVKYEIPIHDPGEITVPVSFTIGASIGGAFWSGGGRSFGGVIGACVEVGVKAKEIPSTTGSQILYYAIGDTNLENTSVIQNEDTINI
ncbi:MAG: hypothetical protein MRQ09_02725 [Candidatus Midichloria sp.]|nr:hypothetical protein [Candidatus Midichloria sp.]